MKKITLQIKDMHCTSCAINIDFDLEDLTGIRTAKTSFAKQETNVEFDEKLINLEKIINQIKTTGYTAFLKS